MSISQCFLFYNQTTQSTWYLLGTMNRASYQFSILKDLFSFVLKLLIMALIIMIVEMKNKPSLNTRECNTDLQRLYWEFAGSGGVFIVKLPKS